MTDVIIVFISDIVECFVELLDDGHLLVVKDDLMIVNHFQHSLGGKQAQIVIFFLLVNDLEHPQYGARIDDFSLVGRLMLDVEVDHVQKLV